MLGWYEEQRQGSDIMQVLRCIVRPECLHGNIFKRNRETVRNPLRKILENLPLRLLMGQHEFVIKRIKKADLT